MQLDLAGKKALITGSSKGIGLEIAKVLYSEGCFVALNARNSKQLFNSVKQFPGAIGVVGDVTQYADAERVVSEVVNAFSGLDILVCNVGSGQSVMPGEETPEEWQRIFALNLWSTTNIVKAAHNILALNKGVIVCVSSICGLEVVEGAPIAYSAAKAALHSFVRGISRPLGKEGIRINAIASGNILFSDSVWTQKIAKNDLAVKAMLKEKVALNCFGTPKDVANLTAYLVSSNASFATGSIWTLDGGQVHS